MTETYLQIVGDHRKLGPRHGIPETCRWRSSTKSSGITFDTKRGVSVYQEVVSHGRNWKLGPWPQCDCQSPHSMLFPGSRLNSSFNNCILPWASFTWLSRSLQPPPLKVGAAGYAIEGKFPIFFCLPYFWGIGWLLRRGALLDWERASWSELWCICLLHFFGFCHISWSFCCKCEGSLVWFPRSSCEAFGAAHWLSSLVQQLRDPKSAFPCVLRA